MMREEITVDNVNQTVQLLLDQTTHRNLLDELCEKLAAETDKGKQAGQKKHKFIKCVGLVSSGLVSPKHISRLNKALGFRAERT